MTDQEIADGLIGARRGTGLAAAPAIADEARAYRIQALVMASLGEIGGWKVGAPAPDGPIACAPLPAATLFAAPCGFDAAVYTQREVESEIGFRLAADLPPRSAPYTADDVQAAIASCHPGLEILQSRYAEPESASPLAHLADFIQSGAYVVGEPIASWQSLDFAALRVTQSIEGARPIHATGNPGGEMMRLLLFLANEGAVWAGGLFAGQFVTCGSWTGKTRAPPNSTVTAAFDGAAPVVIRFNAS